MAYELTADGLLGYFGPDVVARIIELPLVQRHLSALDYRRCQQVLACPQKRLENARKKNAEIEHALLSFDTLREVAMDETLQYLNIEPVREAYSHHYKEYFSLFHKRIHSLPENYTTLPLMLHEVSERKLIMLIKGAIGVPLAAFNNTLLEQHTLF